MGTWVLWQLGVGGGGQGSIRMAVHQSRGTEGTPRPQTKVIIVGKNRNLQRGKSDGAIFGAQIFGSQAPPPPPAQQRPH